MSFVCHPDMELQESVIMKRKGNKYVWTLLYNEMILAMHELLVVVFGCDTRLNTKKTPPSQLRCLAAFGNFSPFIYSHSSHSFLHDQTVVTPCLELIACLEGIFRAEFDW